MTDIPDDVMKAAREAYISLLPRTSKWIADDIRAGLLDGDIGLKAAARAIMAEREACAKIANGFESDADPDAGSIIAAAIRRGPTPPKGGDNEGD